MQIYFFRDDNSQKDHKKLDSKMVFVLLSGLSVSGTHKIFPISVAFL